VAKRACSSHDLVSFHGRGLYYLRAEVSPLKWLTGSNICSLTKSEIAESLNALSDFVSELSGKVFSTVNASICKVDCVEDRIVQEADVIPLFRLFSTINHPKMRRRTFDNTTVYFEPRSEKQYKQIKIYSKSHQLISEKAALEEVKRALGQIRFEASLRTPAINRYVKLSGLPSRVAGEILTSEFYNLVLKSEKDLIHYDNYFLKDQTDIIQRILMNTLDKSPISTAGFVDAYKLFGPGFYKLKDLPLKKRAYQKHLSKSRKFGYLP